VVDTRLVNYTHWVSSPNPTLLLGTLAKISCVQYAGYTAYMATAGQCVSVTGTHPTLLLAGGLPGAVKLSAT